MGRTATQGDQGVAAVVFPYFYAVTYVNIGRIGLCARVKNIINTFGLQVATDNIGNAQLGETGVGYQQGFFEAEGFGFRACFLRTTNTKNANRRNKEKETLFC